MVKYYLAYGSNLNIVQMKSRCPGARPVGIAYINNYRLAFKGSYSSSYLTIKVARGHKVPVVVWEINEKHEQSLDRYEGFPIFYHKHKFRHVEVETFKGDTLDLECFAYIMREDRSYGLPTGTYYMICSQGYKDFNLDDSYLEEALEFSNRRRGLESGSFYRERSARAGC